MHTAFNRFQHCCSLRTITSTTYHQVVGFVPTWRTCKWPLRGSCTDAKDAERNLKGEKNRKTLNVSRFQSIWESFSTPCFLAKLETCIASNFASLHFEWVSKTSIYILDNLHPLIKRSMLASTSRAVDQQGAHLPSEEPDLRLANASLYKVQVILEFHKLRSPLPKWPKFEATKRAGGPGAKPPKPVYQQTSSGVQRQLPILFVEESCGISKEDPPLIVVPSDMT